MRTLAVLVIIALFIAFAFVTPTGDSTLHATMFTEHEEQRKVAQALVSGTSILLDSSAQALLQNSDDIVQVGRTVVADVPGAVRHMLGRVSDDASGAKNILTELIHRETNETLRTQLERISWAEQKNDPRLCGELANVEGMTNEAYGNMLSLCLARTTRDSARCAQITGDNAALLSAACLEGLAAEC